MKQRAIALGALLVAIVIGVVFLVVRGGGSKQVSVSKPKTATTTTRPAPPPVAPLTGLADPGGASRKRCAVTVKIDNTQAGHPKYGIEQADVVYEEVVEGGITRLAAIFNSQAPDRVGPVRSVRKTDQSIVWPIRGVFVYSGGAPYAIASISTAPVVQLDETRAGSMMFRDHSRYAPWNLYAHVDQMYAQCKDPAPPPLFTYRAAAAPVAGSPAASVRVGFLGQYAVTWNWDPASGTWKRFIFGAPEISAAGTQLAPKNVVVMVVPYVGGDPNHANLGAEAELTGTGTAYVFTAGQVVKGTWSRPDKSQPAQLLDAAGAPIRLTPGPTWVELPDVGYPVSITP
ncbi:MAG TPA: DUF3048 domain-containing protein [Acidimicrobiia bacterium]|nr:DUF3048 domain-containing protein [Acidimicrobiia bacterium]